MKTADWKLSDPPTLTNAEREWFDWAESEARAMLEDPDWLRDNSDALTFEGQSDDMSYRLREQAYSVAESDATVAQLGGRVRVLNSLLAKLDGAGYFTNPENPTGRPIFLD